MKKFRPIIRFIKPYKWYLVLAVISMFMVTGMNLAGPWVIRRFIQIVTTGVKKGEVLEEIGFLAILAFGIYLVRAFAQFGTNYISHYAAWKALEDIRQYLYNYIQGLSLRYFQDKQTGELMSRVINDTRNFEILIAHAIPTILVNACMLIGVTAILFVMNVRLTLYTLIPVPLLVLVVFKFSKISRPLFKDAQRVIADVNSVLQDNFTGIKEIKAFTREEAASKQTGKQISAHTRAILRALKVSNAYQPTIEFISSLGVVIIVFFGGRLAFTSELSLENLVTFLLYMNMFYQPITALGQINEGLQQALASGERVLEVLGTEPEIKEATNARQINGLKGKIEFCQVNFKYVDNIEILKDISFQVDAGKTLALVGPTGVGKTTIARLIPRFFEPASGQILIDGIDIREYKLRDLRKHISIVSQDVFLFNGTVKENILFGDPEATDEEVIAAAKAANAHEFIMRLEKGYETQVGERGVKLSGGQKQRISIARAVLKNAPILILDEATSSLDTQTERLIQEALSKLIATRTTIVIAHRLSTIQEADQIIVLKDGEIVEEGNHQELLRKNGLYSELCRAQMGGYLPD
jgi:ATP-binding cassette subfamily B protein/subfamily B ATP-binding cassette protein MsbA